jgi:hypothetical protein
MKTTNSTITKLFRKIAVPLLVLSALTGCVALPSVSLGNGLNPSEKMMWSTYVFGTKHGVATCFVVPRKESSVAGTTVVVVTAAHILATAPHGPFYLGARIAIEGGDPMVMLFELRPTQSAEPIYVKHPFYDIGAFQIQIPPQLASVVRFPSFLKENAIGSDRDRPRAGQDVLFTGFPKVLPGTAGGFPVLRSGKVASYSASGEQRAFLIHTDVYPGDSGGPVFLASRGSTPRLIGMVTARGGRNPNEAVPLAIAVDARTIRETVELAAAHGRRIRPPPSSSNSTNNGVLQSPSVVSDIASWKVLPTSDASRRLLRPSRP